jgi:hypothetical protein
MSCWNSRFRIAANYLDSLAYLFQTRRPQTDLNQAEDASPARFFASSRPATESTLAGKRKEEP